VTAQEDITADLQHIDKAKRLASALPVEGRSGADFPQEMLSFESYVLEEWLGWSRLLGAFRSKTGRHDLELRHSLLFGVRSWVNRPGHADYRLDLLELLDELRTFVGEHYGRRLSSEHAVGRSSTGRRRAYANDCWERMDPRFKRALIALGALPSGERLKGSTLAEHMEVAAGTAKRMLPELKTLGYIHSDHAGYRFVRWPEGTPEEIKRGASSEDSESE
jgi:hypothetical protein